MASAGNQLCANCIGEHFRSVQRKQPGASSKMLGASSQIVEAGAVAEGSRATIRAGRRHESVTAPGGGEMQVTR